MLKSYEVVQQIEADNSRLAKEEIIKREALANNTEFFDGCRLALDSLISFGVQKVPTHSGPDGQGLPWAAFLQLAESLRKRELTGHDARDAIELALTVATQAEWNDWYRRILIKDMRAGFSEKTVNKAIKGTGIAPVPVFECMLAHDGANHENKVTGKKIIQPKLDGVRVLTVIDYEARTVTQYSRNGKEFVNFKHITDELVKHIDEFGRSMVIDGEVVSRSFQDLMKQVHRKDNVEANDARLCAFDIIPLVEFKQGVSTQRQTVRHNILNSYSEVFKLVGNIEIIPQIEVDLDTLVGMVEFKDYNKKAIDEGFEGIMIKDPSALYECKRSVSWLKQKPFIEVSLAVVAVEEGTGKNVGKMGAFICEGEDDGKKIRVNVGSGFTDTDRDEYWAAKDTILGQVVEVRADAATRNQDSEEVWSLRFPRFLRFRGFAKGEKI
jgi:DNA ligase-1